LIIGERFVWLHLPKTGGTSLNRLFRDRNIQGMQVDEDGTKAKHDSIALRESKSEWRLGERKIFITSRRLSDWLISDWQHKRRHMQVPNLDFTPTRCGLSYSFRLGGTWVAADWWLQYFNVTSNVTALRLENLQDDLNQRLLPYMPAGTGAFSIPPKLNAKPNHLHDDEPHFSAEDLMRIHAVNPRWHAWETAVYGGASKANN